MHPPLPVAGLPNASFAQRQGSTFLLDGQPFYFLGFNAPRLAQWAYRSWPGDRAAVDALLRDAARCRRAGVSLAAKQAADKPSAHGLDMHYLTWLWHCSLLTCHSSSPHSLGFPVGRVRVPGEGPDLRVPSERTLFEPYGEVWVSLQPAAAQFDEAAFQASC